MQALTLGSIGGQTIPYRNIIYTFPLVFGSYYLTIVLSNRVALSLGDVQETVERKIEIEGRRKVDLSIDSNTSQFFSRVENWRFDSWKFCPVKA